MSQSVSTGLRAVKLKTDGSAGTEINWILDSSHLCFTFPRLLSRLTEARPHI